MKRLFPIAVIVFLGICNLLLASGFGSQPGEYGKNNTLKIIYSSSLNGNLDGCTCIANRRAGLVTRAAYLKALEDRNRMLLLDAGNIFDRFPDALLAKEILEVYRELGYHAIAVGHQEFSLGVDALLELKGRFPLVSNNISIKPEIRAEVYNAPLSPAPLIINKGSHRIGVISLADPEVFDSLPEGTRNRIKIDSPETILKPLLSALEQDTVDLTILLYHGLYDNAKKLLRDFKGIDVAILGHEELLIEAEMVGNSILVSPGRDGDRLGILDITLGKNGSKKFNNSFNSFDYELDQQDPSVMRRVERYRMEMRKRLTTP